MPSLVVVVDTGQRPLAPCHRARARQLLAKGKAAVWRHAPFTLILTRPVSEATPAPVCLPLDPGSHSTGLATVHDTSSPSSPAWTHEASAPHIL
jgi:hypothetical protein